MLSKAHLLVRAFASKVESRPELTGICVRPDRTAATDSYILAEVRTNPGKAASPSDFPIIPGMPTARELPAPFIMPHKVADDLAKSIPKANRNLPILDHAAYLGTSTPDGKHAQTITYVTTDLATAKPVTFAPINGAYPAYDAIIPTPSVKNPPATVRLNAEYLLRAAKFLQDFNKLDMGRIGLNDIEIEVRGPHDPVVFKAHGKKHTATVLIMPIKV